MTSMKTLTAVVSTTALVIGLGGGVLAYQAAASQSASEVTQSVAAPGFHSVNAADPGAKVKFAPCQPPAKLVRHACVVHVVKTVAVPTSSLGTPVASSATPVPSPRSSSASEDSGTSGSDDQYGSDDDSYDDQGTGEDEGEHGDHQGDGNEQEDGG